MALGVSLPSPDKTWQQANLLAIEECVPRASVPRDTADAMMPVSVVLGRPGSQNVSKHQPTSSEADHDRRRWELYCRPPGVHMDGGARGAPPSQ